MPNFAFYSVIDIPWARGFEVLELKIGSWIGPGNPRGPGGPNGPGGPSGPGGPAPAKL